MTGELPVGLQFVLGRQDPPHVFGPALVAIMFGLLGQWLLLLSS
jgi:hypothetical protein